MKAAVIGTGKTGGHVIDLLEKDHVEVLLFDEHNKPTAEKLKEADVAIIFVPGNAAEELTGPLLQSAIPAVWGTTGYEWPKDLDERVGQTGTSWIIASNFSLGMNLVRKCLNVIGQGSRFLGEADYLIHEVHHKDKQDAPSGTALSWKQWLGRESAVITSERKGDVKGIHSLHVKTNSESIYIQHEAHNRGVFARGAIWSARYLLNNPDTPPGLHTFESIVDLAFSKA